MKIKDVFLLTLIISAVIMTACSKEEEQYTCECDGSAASLENQTYILKEESESDAKSTCDGYAEGTGGLVVCTIK